MRLQEEIIKHGILHPDKDVRSEAVLYFSRSYNHDDSIMPLAIQAVERYGWDKAFTVASCMTGLPLSEATLPWVLAQLQREDAKQPDPYGWPARWHTLNSLLSNADAELLARHQQAIADVKSLEAEVRSIVSRRIALLSCDDETCWAELEQFCVDIKDLDNISEADLDYAFSLIEAISRHRDRNAEKVLGVLAEKIEDLESNPKAWMEIFAVKMAGEMRLEPAIPLIIAKLREGDEEDEWLNEQCESALVKIGGDAAIHAVAEMYRHGDERMRRAACFVLEHVHSDLAVATALEFLPNEKDPSTRAFLAGGLASHFAFETIEPLRQLVLDGTYDSSYTDVKRDVVIAATLMNVEFPERESWREELEIKWLEMESKRLEREADRLREEIRQAKLQTARLERENRLLARQYAEQDDYEDENPRSKNKIGRNDPCPCGSGKKFKKCCLKKQGLSPLD
jgi:hypothetical protein